MLFFSCQTFASSCNTLASMKLSVKLAFESVLKFEFVISIIAWYHTSSKDAGVPISGIWHCCDITAVPYARYWHTSTLWTYMISCNKTIMSDGMCPELEEGANHWSVWFTTRALFMQIRTNHIIGATEKIRFCVRNHLVPPSWYLTSLRRLEVTCVMVKISAKRHFTLPHPALTHHAVKLDPPALHHKECQHIVDIHFRNLCVTISNHVMYKRHSTSQKRCEVDVDGKKQGCRTVYNWHH